MNSFIQTYFKNEFRELNSKHEKLISISTTSYKQRAENVEAEIKVLAFIN